MLKRFVADESAQDVVEYALLCALVGITAIAAWQLVAGSVAAFYTAADGSVQTLSACTPDPGGGGC